LNLLPFPFHLADAAATAFHIIVSFITFLFGDGGSVWAAKDIFHLDNRMGMAWKEVVMVERCLPFVPQKFISALRQFAMVFVVI